MSNVVERMHISKYHRKKKQDHLKPLENIS